jgi:hypothetical protein
VWGLVVVGALFNFFSFRRGSCGFKDSCKIVYLNSFNFIFFVVDHLRDSLAEYRYLSTNIIRSGESKVGYPV